MKKVMSFGLSLAKLPLWLCLLVAGHWSLVTWAQAQSPQLPPPTRYTVSFESQHGEAFTVFIDGDPVNRMPQSRVMVNDISDQNHQVVVVLKRPAEKAAVLNLRPGEANVVVNVNYDSRLEQVFLYTPTHNRAEAYDKEWIRTRDEIRRRQERKPAVEPIPHPAPHTAAPVVVPASDDDVAAMEQRMKSQSFDSDRLALGKVIVASANLTASQIARLARTIDYSNSQIEFLKYAYHYCLDRENYYRTIDVLTFSSDKKKVLDYIATQH